MLAVVLAAPGAAHARAIVPGEVVVKYDGGTSRALTEAALAPDVAFVGEELGGLIFPTFHPAFDGMSAVVRVLEMMARLDVRLHQLTRAVPESHMVRLEVPCPDERKGAVMRRLIEATKHFKVELIEGVRVQMGEDWVAAIPDADRAIFHVVAEASDRDRAQRADLRDA